MREGGGVVKSLESPSTGTGGGSHSGIFFDQPINFSGDEMQFVLFDMPDQATTNTGGRPRWNKVTQYQEFVEYLIEIGVNAAEIAQAVGVSLPTLSHYFSPIPAWQARWGHRKRSRNKAASDAATNGGGDTTGKGGR